MAFGKRGVLRDDARCWTQEECIESARKVAVILIPDEFTLGESYTSEDGDREDTRILTDIVLRADPRLRVSRIDLPINPWTGLPEIVRAPLRWPQVGADRIAGILPETTLAAEALRIHRLLPELSSARLARCQLVYQVPDFRQNRNELTPAHLGNIERQEAIPIYQWLAFMRRPGHDVLRSVWIDARTGRGMAMVDWEFDYLGETKPPAPVSRTDSGL